jgi:hypothetical protein
MSQTPPRAVLTDAPAELQVAIQEFWPADEWDNAAAISQLESGFDAFALANTVDETHPCGSFLRELRGQRVTAERSVGYFQINACNFPDWEWQRLYNARHNAGTAHMLWSAANGWRPWYFSALHLGLI